MKKNGKAKPAATVLIGFDVGDGPASEEELRLITTFLADMLKELLSGEDEEEE